MQLRKLLLPTLGGVLLAGVVVGVAVGTNKDLRNDVSGYVNEKNGN